MTSIDGSHGLEEKRMARKQTERDCHRWVILQRRMVNACVSVDGD